MTLPPPGQVVVGVVAARLGPGTLGAHLRAQAPLSLGGGVASMLAYALVLWAMTRAPIATVAALRETSVLIAAWLGVWLFGEPQTARVADAHEPGLHGCLHGVTTM